MRNFCVLLCVLICGGIFVLVAPTPALATETFPCCEGGSDPGKACEVNDDCKGICTGGTRKLLDSCDVDQDCKNGCTGGLIPGNDCESDSDCTGVCLGGKKAGNSCSVASDCPDACVGGSNNGGECNDDSVCPGGSCSDTGTCSLGACSLIGTCSGATCTGVCDEQGPKSPSEPVSVSWEFPVCLDTVEVEEHHSAQPRP